VLLENKYAQKDTKKILLLFTPWPGAHSNKIYSADNVILKVHLKCG